MPGQDLVQASVDATLIPEAAHRFAQRALREHQRAEKDVIKAVEHIVKSGQALLKAYDLCEHGQWVGFFELHFGEKTTRDDGTRPLTLRTAQKYMQLARDWSRLIAEHPQGFSSQRQAFKALAALVRGDEPTRIRAIGAARGANATSAHGKGAARGANGGAQNRTGPVWRVSGPFVNEALTLVSSADSELSRLVDDGFPVEAAAFKVHAALERLQAMLGRQLDEADAQQAASERPFVVEESPLDETPLTLELESEDDHD
ncbi:MAG TPA: hypothetical protein VFI31_23585 [Pirellulales bacterium]|nr:hypothetical protein [Pirellulales bacterium]